MRLRQIALIGSFLFFLAGCGNNGSSPTPSPAPAPNLPATPPSEGVQYYGEWGWRWQETGEYAYFTNEGTFSVVETATNAEGLTGSSGLYQTCYEGTCYDSSEGRILFGTRSNGGQQELVIVLYRLDTLGDAVTTYEAIDSDGVISKDAQGRDIFEGRGRWIDSVVAGGRQGNFTAVLTNQPIRFQP